MGHRWDGCVVDNTVTVLVYLYVLCVGVDMSRFERFERRQPSAAQFTVGYIGRLSVEKSVGLFVLSAYDIVQEMRVLSPDTRVLFRVIGDGALLPHLKDLTRMLGLESYFEYIGWLSGDAYLTALNSIDVLVNPSQVNETFCIVNIEAMAMSIPVITFGVGGIGEYIDADPGGDDPSQPSPHPQLFSVARNSLLLNEASPSAITAAVLHLFHNPSLRLSLGSAGHALINQSFTTSLQMAQYERVYEEIVGR